MMKGRAAPKASVTDSRTNTATNLSNLPMIRSPAPLSVLLLAALALSGACDWGMAPPPPVPSSLTVSPASLDFDALAETAQLTAKVLDQSGQVIAGATVTWESGDPAVASVSGTGLVTSVANGSATVVATAGNATAGSATGSAAVEVEQVPRSILVSGPQDSLTVGDSIQMTAEALDGGGSAVPGSVFNWTSSDPKVAVVNQEGWVRAKAPGSADISASLGEISAFASLVALPLPEPDVLAAIYETANGALWKDNTNWLTSEPLSEWYGVHLDDDGHIAHLLLTDNGLIGSFPPEIGNLSRLESLHLGLNDLAGPIPPEIAQLTRLKSLELTYNSLSGSIPPEIGELASLEWLGLFGNGLTGSIPSEIGKLASLQSLDLCYNQLTGPVPPEIGDLGNLESLKLCGIDSNPSAGNRLTGSIPPEIGKLAKLRVLNLGANLLSGPIPPEIGDLANLDSLSLYSNGLTGIPSEIGALASLESALLYGNRLAGRIPPEIGKLGNLESLVVGLGLTSGANLLTGPIPPEIGRLGRLRRLDLGGNDLTGSIPMEIGDLAALERLELGSNALTGPLPPEIGNLGNLTRLSLCYNGLVGPVPPQMGRMATLRQLYLCRNGFTGPVPPELGDLTELRHLNVAVNQLTGRMPDSMVSLSRLQSFNWGLNNGLCVPITDAFLAWLSGIGTGKGDLCAEGAGAAAVPPREPGAVPCSVTVTAGPERVPGAGNGRADAGERSRPGERAVRGAVFETRAVGCGGGGAGPWRLPSG